MRDQNKISLCIYRQHTQAERIYFPCQRQKLLYLICITHVYIYILHTATRYQTYMGSLVKLRKRSVRIISGVNPRTHSDPLFTDLKLLKCQEMSKYLVVRHIHRIYNDGVTLFEYRFIKIVQMHNYDNRQRDHYNVPGFKSRLGKINLRFNNVIVLSYILSIGVPVDTSHAVFLQKL